MLCNSYAILKSMEPKLVLNTKLRFFFLGDVHYSACETTVNYNNSSYLLAFNIIHCDNKISESPQDSYPNFKE